MGYIFTKPLHFIILSFLLWQLSWAQVKVSGNISSAQGDPLPGATVTLTGKSLTTLSDEKGNYSIEAQEGDSLEFSMGGFESAVRKVSDSNVINVKLPAQKTQELQEVVVNAAYRKIKAEEFTGALNEVKKETIARNSGSSAQSALENAPGVIVNQSSGQAGSGFNVRVRGVASLNGSQDPLYLIDGVPVASGDFSTSIASSSNITSLINPEDIESMTVLQDAATSLYGSRAANGVVVITTKKGKRGQTKFSLKVESGFSDRAYDSYKKISGEEFRKLRKEGLRNQYLQSRENTPEEAERKASEDLEKLYPVPPGGYVNWQDLLFKKGSLQNYQFTVADGTDKTRILTNLGFYKEKSIVYDSDFKRASMRVNVDHKATKNFSFGVNTSFSFADINGVSDQKAYYANPWFAVNYFLNPTSPLYEADGNYTERINNQYPNLARERGMNVNNQKQYRLLLNPWAEFKWRNISFKSNNQLDFLNSLSQSYYPSNTNNGQAYEGVGQKACRSVLYLDLVQYGQLRQAIERESSSQRAFGIGGYGS